MYIYIYIYVCVYIYLCKTECKTECICQLAGAMRAAFGDDLVPCTPRKKFCGRCFVFRAFWSRSNERIEDALV